MSALHRPQQHLVVVHDMMMIGPPGAGKTLLARSVPGILPRLSLDEALDITRVYSISDLIPEGTPLIRHRPFRAPHHTISHAGLVGGGRWPRPGEVSLAHRGVLFLDELPEFGPRNLETLRQPMEDKVVTISRASGSLTFPASFQLIAATDPRSSRVRVAYRFLSGCGPLIGTQTYTTDSGSSGS
jgi:magnesium chelatase family protein